MCVAFEHEMWCARLHEKRTKALEELFKRTIAIKCSSTVKQIATQPWKKLPENFNISAQFIQGFLNELGLTRLSRLLNGI